MVTQSPTSMLLDMDALEESAKRLLAERDGGCLSSGKRLWLYVAICRLFVIICGYMWLYNII
jgi:hypothetical protein